jgi:transcriptional regulator with XRE-family HTH domain
MKKTPKPTAAEKLGKKVRARRDELGLSQEQVAKRAHMTVSKLSELETGRFGKRGPTLSRLVQIATALKVSPSSLLDC